MNDATQRMLLACLTAIGLAALGGMIGLEAMDRPVLGGLPAVAGAVVASMVGLVTQWGQSIKPLSAKMDRIQSDLTGNTATTNQIATDVNGKHTALVQEIADLKAQIARAGLVQPDSPSPTPHNHV
jgi:hypothetical protein